MSIIRNCKFCNKTFIPKSIVNKHCSKRCFRRSWDKLNPWYTKKDPKDYSTLYVIKGRKRPEISGPNHPNYRGGVTLERDLIRGSIEYKEFQQGVFNHDNWCCKKCNKHGGILVAHHILNFADHLELRFEVSNGITFCPDCHNLFHKIYTCFNNTRDQINDFLIPTLELSTLEMSGNSKTCQTDLILST